MRGHRELFIDDANEGLIYLFNDLWNIIKEVAVEIEMTQGDVRVVDAIYAVNKVRFS
jgi:hypothetical protein